MQIKRLFEITYILLNKKIVTAKELAEHFAVSTRTIYRDIDAINLAGIPVYTDKGKGGGIKLLPDFVFNKSILNEQEQNDILFALQSLSGIKAAETDQVLKKLSAIFNKDTPRWLEVDFSDWGAANNQTFNNFKTAILEHRITEFDYYNTKGEMIRRRAEPLQLLFKSKSWYVKAFCLIRLDMRLFKLSRVHNLVVLDDKFTNREIFANSSVPDSVSCNNGVEVFKFKISPKMACRVYDEFGLESIKKQKDGSFAVSISCPEDDWVYGMILSYGEYMEVLKPEHVRKIIKKKSRQILKKYL